MNGLKKLHWKQIFAIFVVFTLQSAGVSAQTVDNPPLGKPVTMTPLDRSNPEFQITERGAHHRKWERVDKIIRPDGEEEEVVRSYTELASGLNYWDEDAADWMAEISTMTGVPPQFMHHDDVLGRIEVPLLLAEGIADEIDAPIALVEVHPTHERLEMSLVWLGDARP